MGFTLPVPSSIRRACRRPWGQSNVLLLFHFDKPIALHGFHGARQVRLFPSRGFGKLGQGLRRDSADQIQQVLIFRGENPRHALRRREPLPWKDFVILSPSASLRVNSAQNPEGAGCVTEANILWILHLSLPRCAATFAQNDSIWIAADYCNTGIPAILACHSLGPVWWTDVPSLSTATVTGMSFTSNS